MEGTGTTDMLNGRIEATEIVPGLYQGSRPPVGPVLARSGVDVLVLAAVEHQPQAVSFPGVRVIHVPLEDRVDPSEEDRQVVRAVGREVAASVAHGERVLVTCYMGRNRSGWIVGHALVDLGYPVSRVLPLIRSKRPNAMNNRAFSADILTRRDERFARRARV